MVVAAENLLSSLHSSLIEARDLRAIFSRLAENLGEALEAHRVLVIPAPESALAKQQIVEWTYAESKPEFDSYLLSLADNIQKLTDKQAKPLVINDILRSPLYARVFEAASLLAVASVLAVSLRFRGKQVACIALCRSSLEPLWQESDAKIVSQVAAALPDYLVDFLSPNHVSRAERESKLALIRPESAHSDKHQLYRRLVENSDAIMFSLDLSGRINFISRRALDFLGLMPEDFVSSKRMNWLDMVFFEDLQRVRARATEAVEEKQAYEEEFRVVNHITARVRWLLTRFVPVRESQDEIIGWDAFGIDITARKEAQESLDSQSKKIRALYTVSSAIRGYLDPANIAARGLSALCSATGADAGLCYLYGTAKPRTLSLVAHHGFSADFVNSQDVRSDLRALLSPIAEEGQSVVIPDIQADIRTSRTMAREEGMRSAVIVPIAVEDEIFGALALFTREVGKFDGGDVMLVAAAANQIGLAARQAHLFAAYRKQTKNLSALYRMSHELSPLPSLEQVFKQAFIIIRDELGLKRLWLGLFDESGTRIVGQAAYGPGWRRRLVEINVDISQTENPIRRVQFSRHAEVVTDPNELFGALGLKRFVSRFAIKAVGLAPLIARGQVLGVLAVQPGSLEPSFEEDELALLSSLASEIGVLVMAKRLEERINEGEKMRSAGLLAAGIAHNFNNLLQAVLGQASLIEMQKHNEAQVQKAARIIGESAQKGAALVRQLLSFANLEEPKVTQCNLNDLLSRETKSFSQLILANQSIQMSLRKDLPTASVDPSHLMRIVSTLVTNASEAMKDKGGLIQIFTDLAPMEGELANLELPEGRYLRVGVRDSGIGMDLETKRRCFEPFFTTKNVDPSSGLGLSGSGLGLAAAYALSRRNGGMLVVDSRPQQGSVFTVYVPVTSRRSIGNIEPLKKNLVAGINVDKTADEKPQRTRRVTARNSIKRFRPEDPSN